MALESWGKSAGLREGFTTRLLVVPKDSLWFRMRIESRRWAHRTIIRDYSGSVHLTMDRGTGGIGLSTSKRPS